ncbi:MAG: beta-ketoacyl-ACP reductase [Actinomycetota bacterium]
MPERVAVVTGASRGIGRAIAVALSADHFVAVNFRSGVEEAKATLSAIEAGGGQGTIVQADVSDPAGVDALFTEVEDLSGPVEVLVNNAGIRRDGLALRMRDRDWDDVIATDLTGPFLCARRAMRSMLRLRFGRIVNMSSIAGLRGNAGQVNYCAAKAGLIGLTKALAREIGKKGITVNAVAPGLVDTDLTAALSDDQRAALLQEVPGGRAGRPEDVAAIVSFLCSEAAANVNGAVLVTDGGMTA